MDAGLANLLIRNARLREAGKAPQAALDVRFSGGKRQKESPDLQSTDAELSVSGRELLLMPALIDLACQFGEPGFEYREGIATGLQAAAAGGYAAVAHLPATNPVADNRAIVEAQTRAAQHAGGSQLLPLGALTQGLSGAHLAELGDMADAGVVGFTNGNQRLDNSGVMLRAFEYARSFDLLIMQRAGDQGLEGDGVAHDGRIATELGLRGLPAEAEEIGLARDLSLVRRTGVRYHVSTISTKQAVSLVRRAKDEGLPVTADVAIHQLLLTDECLRGYDAKYRLLPPPRSEDHRQALIQGVRDGTVDAISSNHDPRSAIEKSCDFASALAGATTLETALPLALGLVREGHLSLERLVDAMSTRPAAILGLEPPGFKEGQLASCTLVDLDDPWTPTADRLYSRGTNPPFADAELSTRVRLTLIDGKLYFPRSAS